DTTCKKEVRLQNGKTISPIDHQRLYLEAAQKAFGKEEDADTRWILKNWEEVLDDLDSAPDRLIDRLDWVAKKWLLESFMEAEGCGWDDPRLKAFDLEYHNLHPDRGLFIGLEMEGRMERLTTDAEIKQAILAPPADSRASIRGICADKFY